MIAQVIEPLSPQKQEAKTSKALNFRRIQFFFVFREKAKKSVFGQKHIKPYL